MKKVCVVSLIILALSFSVSAQCNGVYFKETSRQVFSDPFISSVIEDIDNDGLEDIFGYSRISLSSYRLTFYKRLSATSFDTTAKVTTLTDVRGEPIMLGDVNNDGKKDVTVVHVTTPPVLTTYLNDGTGRFLTNTPGINVTDFETFLVAGDLNNDGKADLVSMIWDSVAGINKPYYRLAQPDNTFGPSVLIASATTFPTWGILPSNILVEDLNNDGLRDIAFVPYESQSLRVLTNTGNMSFTEASLEGFNQLNTERLRTVDLNNDGKKDFVSSRIACCGISKVVVAANSGTNTFTGVDVPIPPVFGPTTYRAKEFVPGDFDADGDTDIILPSEKNYLLLKNQGDLTFAPQEFRSYLNIDSTTMSPGDGRADGLSFVRSFLDGYVRLTSPNAIYHRNTAVRFRQNVCDPIGQTKSIDFDGDGFIDRAFWNPSTGAWRYYTENTQNNQVTFQWGATGDIPVPNDYDGDGRTDYAVFRPSNGTWWIFRSSDQQMSAQQFGFTGDKPVPADYNGDGKADIAVYRPSEGIWHLLLSGSNQYQAFGFGVAEDTPLPADYDGDGKADISVYRPSAGNWYRINSSDNSFFAVNYGVSTDKPVLGDFDGDGKTNIAVFRDGTWYVLRSDFSTSVFFWGVANDIPFFGDAEPIVYVYRRNSSSMYSNIYPEGFAGLTTTYSTGNSFNEKLVSTILPVE